MTRKLFLCAAGCATMLVVGPSVAQILFPPGTTVIPIKPKITPPVGTVPNVTPTPSPEPTVPTRWTVQAYYRHMPENALPEPMSATAARTAAIAACEALAVREGKTAAERASIKAAVPSFRGIGGEAWSEYFPCDVALNVAGGRTSYIRVVAQRTVK